MGKSTVAKQFAAQGCLISDADAIAHRVMQPNGAAFEAVANHFPRVIVEGKIDRQALGKIVFQDKEALAWLEGVVHPLVRQAHQQHIHKANRMGYRAVILEVPLLYETGRDEDCDQVVVVTAPAFLQKQRVLRREGMTEEKFQRIISQQIADAQKRRMADFVIHTSMGRHASLYQVRNFMKSL